MKFAGALTLQGGSVFSDPRVSTALNGRHEGHGSRAMAQIHGRSRNILGFPASPLMVRWWRARREKGGWKRVQGRALGRVLKGVVSGKSQNLRSI